MKLGPKSILRYVNEENLDVYSLEHAISSNCNLFDEIVGLKLYSSGCTTIAFRKDEKTVLCLSFDYNKVLYLKKSGTVSNFKFIRFAPFLSDFGTQIIMIYEMEYLKSLEEGLEGFELNEFNLKLSAFDQIEKSEDLEDDAQEILDDVDALINIRTIYRIQNLKHTPRCKFDLHDGQFRINNLGQLVCFDPIISDNIYY